MNLDKPLDDLIKSNTKPKGKGKGKGPKKSGGRGLAKIQSAAATKQHVLTIKKTAAAIKKKPVLTLAVRACKE